MPRFLWLGDRLTLLAVSNTVELWIESTPLEGVSSPAIDLNNVVLPLPEEPSSTMTSPSCRSSEIPLRTGWSPKPKGMSVIESSIIEPNSETQRNAETDPNESNIEEGQGR